METMANIRSICHTIIAVFSEMTDLSGQKQFKPFMLLYNTGLPFMVAMLFARGIPRPLELDLPNGASAAISGLAGTAHIIMTAASQRGPLSKL